MQHIIKTTEAIIKKKGCYKTTIREIVAQSGISMGGIYHYVKGKDDLFGVILQSKIDNINEEFHRAVQFCDNEDLLTTVVKGIFRNFLDENIVLKDIFIYLLSQRQKKEIHEILLAFRDKWVITSTNWIEMGQKGGFIPEEIKASELSSMLATYFYGMMIDETLNIHHSEEQVHQYLSNVLRLKGKNIF